MSELGRAVVRVRGNRTRSAWSASWLLRARMPSSEHPFSLAFARVSRPLLTVNTRHSRALAPYTRPLRVLTLLLGGPRRVSGSQVWVVRPLLSLTVLAQNGRYLRLAGFGRSSAGHLRCHRSGHSIEFSSASCSGEHRSARQKVVLSSLLGGNTSAPKPIGSAMQVIAIDGISRAGKTTVAKLLSERIGAEFLEGGALYRAITHSSLSMGLQQQIKRPSRRMSTS